MANIMFKRERRKDRKGRKGMFDFSQEQKELIEAGFARAGQNIALDYGLQSRNGEMAELVNRYKQEEADWYQSAQLKDNAFELASQGLWYMHYLNKKRLQKMGIGLQYKTVSQTPSQVTSEQRFPTWNYGKEGNSVVCRLQDYERTQKTYLRGEKVLYKDEPRLGNTESYYITMARDEHDTYICPNCGNGSTLENLLDGCDYCNTRFEVKDFSTKISSVFQPKAFMKRRDGKDTWKGFVYALPTLLLIPIGIVLGLVLAMLTIFIPGIGEGLAGLSFAFGTMLAFGGVFLYIIVAAIIAFVKMAPKKSVDPALLIARDDPQFSEEVFIAGLTNKVLSLHYAESMKDVAPFIEEDMSDLIRQCDSVIDCRLTECVLTDYQKDAENHHLEAEAGLRVLTCRNDVICEARPVLRLRLGRSNQVFSNAGSEVMAYRCPNCGASVSLLTGGRCEYCDSTINLKKYDWVIERVEIVKKKK